VPGLVKIRQIVVEISGRMDAFGSLGSLESMCSTCMAVSRSFVCPIIKLVNKIIGK